MRFIFFGTPKFAAIILNQLIENGYKPIAVVTNPDKPIKRSSELKPSAVKTLCIEKLSCQIFQLEKIKDPEFLNELAKYKADLFITAAYGKIFPESVLLMPRIASINVHASLLPEYRGANPVRRALMDGKLKTGVTIMHMTKELDAGDMIEKSPLEIHPDWDFGILEEKLALLGAKTLIKTIPPLLAGVASKVTQNQTLATYAPKLEKEECEIHFDRSAKQLQDQIRALSPYPGAFTKVYLANELKRLKLFKVHCLKEQLPPKELVFKGDRMIVGCSTDSIEILELQLEGKKRMSVKDFLRGLATHDIKLL